MELSRARAANRVAQAVVVVSKNANVATGPAGRADAEELTAAVAAHIGADVEDVLVASTGVIGRPYPMHRLRDFLGRLGELVEVAEAEPVATAMMTTDTVAKVAEAHAGAARVVGVAKGVGMIEPDMATMLAFVFTDAEVDGDDLDAVARRVVARTFNSLSVDTDTSTSDTFAVLASGRAGPVHASELEHALHDVCLQLTRKLACDGEGATKLLTVTVTGAADELQARTVAKSVVNSPLVKTAVHGADPNWGRVVMAVGKCSQYTDIDPDRVTVRFGVTEVYPRLLSDDGLAEVATAMKGAEVGIGVDLGVAGGDASWTVYGCDLGDGYVRINADYTT